MNRFGKLRELVTLARSLEAEARTLAPGGQGRIDRMAEAAGYRAKAEWLAGRIDGAAYAALRAEVADAAAYPV